MTAKVSRRQVILETLAQLLESQPGARITTAGLAAAVGVSEAALYRHFPSKARMFEGLIEFVEDTLFERANAICRDGSSALAQLDNLLQLFLIFAERNPGISRIIHGDALSGETERLRKRVSQLHDRYEMQLKQVIRDAEINEKLRCSIPAASAANLLLAAAQGRVGQYVRSDFGQKPTERWPEQWELLSTGLFRNYA